MSKTKTCKQCQKEVPIIKNVRFCSEECRVLNRRVRQKAARQSESEMAIQEERSVNIIAMPEREQQAMMRRLKDRLLDGILEEDLEDAYGRHTVKAMLFSLTDDEKKLRHGMMYPAIESNVGSTAVQYLRPGFGWFSQPSHNGNGGKGGSNNAA